VFKQDYVLVNSLGSHEIPTGISLRTAASTGSSISGRRGSQRQGSGTTGAADATVISGILNQRLPWRLVLMGVALVIAGGDTWSALAGLRRTGRTFPLPRRERCLPAA